MHSRLAMKPGRPDDIILHRYDQALESHGDTARGAHWPNETDRRLRQEIMLDLMGASPPDPCVLCDLGCGTGSLLSLLKSSNRSYVQYVGVDRSEAALKLARAKHPDGHFVCLDVNKPAENLQILSCDYLVCNGVFTVKWSLGYQEMWTFMETALRHIWPHVSRGMAFNVMSKVVDWERDDLFHVPMDDLAALLYELAGRKVVFRSDYGLYEYTAYVYRT